MFHSTKIMATLGPASSSKAMVKKLLNHGTNSFRLNTAHGDLGQYNRMVANVKAVSNDVPVVVDLKGPEMRCVLKNPLSVSRGTTAWFGFSAKDEFSFNRDFYSNVKVGSKIFFEDGRCGAKVIEKKDRKLKLGFSGSFELKSNKGVNVPGVGLGFPALSKRDKNIISWAKGKGLHVFALSFCRSASDVLALRKALGDEPIIISKIESNEGVKNFREILSVSDGIMVARGDLGVEVKKERIPLLQKKMIMRCLNEGKFSIVATQMLESMIKNPYPSRAEVSDIANSVLDGADCLMLSGETAIGSYPVESVKEMRSACEAVEEKVPNLVDMKFSSSTSDSVTKTIYRLSHYLKVNRIIAFTKSGYTCQMISRFRTKVPVIGVSWKKRTMNLLGFYFGVVPVAVKKEPRSSREIISLLMKQKLLKKGNKVILTGNMASGKEQHSNMIEVQEIR